MSVNPSIITFFFITNGLTDRQKNYQQKIHRLNIFVYDFIGKLITNRMVVQILMENSVSKYKNSGSVLIDKKFTNIL